MGLPLAAFLGAILGLLLLATTQLTLRDVDLYWHLIAGRELASGIPVDGVGRTWSFAPDQLPWTSTQWLAELSLFYLFEWGGWPAMAAFRIVSAATILGALAWTTLRGRPLPPASGPFILASLAVWLHSQERPQQATLLGATLLGGVLVRGLTAASLPRWWCPGTRVWSNLHGGWVLVPAILGLVTVGRILDQGSSDRAARRAAFLGAGSLAIGALTPAGVGNITAAVRVSNAASGIIAEWEPTQPMTVIGSLSIGMLLLSVTGWTRSRQKIPRSEVVAVITLLLFAWSAWRNLTPALLLMAPLVAERLCTAFPRAGVRREPCWSAPVGVGIFIACTVAALALLPMREHLPRDRYPVALASAISELPGPQRVLNDYKVAGLVLLWVVLMSRWA